MKTIKIADKEIEVRCCVKECKTNSNQFFFPKTKIWAQGYAKTSHSPVIMEISSIFCNEHKPTQDKFLEDFFPPENRKKFREIFTKMRKVPLNWASAEVHWEEIK